MKIAGDADSLDTVGGEPHLCRDGGGDLADAVLVAVRIGIAQLADRRDHLDRALHGAPELGNGTLDFLFCAPQFGDILDGRNHDPLPA